MPLDCELAEELNQGSGIISKNDFNLGGEMWAKGKRKVQGETELTKKKKTRGGHDHEGSAKHES